MIKFLAFTLFMLFSSITHARTVDMVVEATAYQYDFDDGITYTENECVPYYTVAVDPDVIPLGSQIYLYRTGEWFLADDIGGEIEGYAIDIAMESEEECWEYGVREERIMVVFPEEDE